VRYVLAACDVPAVSLPHHMGIKMSQWQTSGLRAVELQGADCSGQWMYAGDNSVNCYSNCSDAGVCKSGWCHCEPGRWGMDCSRTKVRSPAAACISERQLLWISACTVRDPACWDPCRPCCHACLHADGPPLCVMYLATTL
jgi:hypothetical protein